jgi:flavin-dependent dehydrogenase
MKRCDVLVVGAGPGGSAAAISMAKRGFDVVLADRATFPRDKACGEFVNPAACELIEETFDVRRAELGGRPIANVRLELRQPPALEIPMSSPGISVPRMHLDKLLLDRCRSVGVEVLEGHSVRSLSHGNRIVASGPSDIEAEILIAADGAHSAIARQEGLTRPEPRLERIGIVAHFEGCPPPSNEEPSVWMFPSSGTAAMFGFAHQANGTAVLSGSLPKIFARQIAAGASRFLRRWIWRQPGLRRRLGPATLREPVRTTACFGHTLTRTCIDRVLFVGDAARFVDPFTGEGIHHAVESGVLAAQCASLALASGNRDLSAFQIERAPLESRYSLCDLVQGICTRPELVNFIGERLRRRPGLAATLVSALVDLVPARVVLNPGFFARALF